MESLTLVEKARSLLNSFHTGDPAAIEYTKTDALSPLHRCQYTTAF